ncbi:MAG: hypothetical protein HY699_12690 [Deltaproteobacteria bacterium]|nr:hypothetical protein [Deltaproteobacteria bacterium]
MSVYYLPVEAADAHLLGASDGGDRRVQDLAVFSDSTSGGSAPQAAIGDVDGDGDRELIVGEAGAAAGAACDRVEVYRIGPAQPAQRLGQFAAFEGSALSGSSNLAVADVDASQPGDEIVVGDDGRRRRASRVRVFGGLAGGGMHLLATFRAFSSRAAVRRPVAFVLGDVRPDHGAAVKEIVTGDAHGWVHLWGVQQHRAVRLGRIAAFAQTPRRSADRLAVGDVLPQQPGDEIIVADDGTRGDGLVRIFASSAQTPALEVQAFAPGEAPAGVEVWVADVIASQPGAELIVGQGSTGGTIRVLSLASGGAQQLLELPDPQSRASSLRAHLAVGALMPDLSHNVLAVAQADPSAPVQVFDLDSGGTVVAQVGSAPSAAGAEREVLIGNIAAAP